MRYDLREKTRAGWDNCIGPYASLELARSAAYMRLAGDRTLECIAITTGEGGTMSVVECCTHYGSDAIARFLPHYRGAHA